MLRDLSLSAIYMGLLSAAVGYSASFAILLAGMASVGATEQQAATGLFFAALGMGVCGMGWSWVAGATRGARAP